MTGIRTRAGTKGGSGDEAALGAGARGGTGSAGGGATAVIGGPAGIMTGTGGTVGTVGGDTVLSFCGRAQEARAEVWGAKVRPLRRARAVE